MYGIFHVICSHIESVQNHFNNNGPLTLSFVLFILPVSPFITTKGPKMEHVQVTNAFYGIDSILWNMIDDCGKREAWS